MSNTTEVRDKLWNRNYIMVLLVCTLSAFSFYTNQTILSKHLTTDVGASMTLAGTIVGLFSLTSLFCRPFCGILADRMNKIVLMMISNILMTIGLIGFAFSRSIPLFIAMRIINGGWVRASAIWGSAWFWPPPLRPAWVSPSVRPSA